MRNIEFQKKMKKIIMCLTVVMAMFAASKAIPVYAGDFTTATTLPTNGVWSGKCEIAKGTTDYYKFTISTAGEMDIKLMSYTSDLECVLYDSNFEKISDISWLETDGSETSPKTESMAKWLSQGTYYVTVEKMYGDKGNYRLYASFTSSGITAAEKDSFDLPQNMPVNGKVTGVLTYSNREDWYKVTISSAGKYRNICQCSSSVNSMEIFLYDMNLSKLHSMYLFADTRSYEIELKPGIYYIKVESRYGGTYSYQFNEAIPAGGEILTDVNNQAQYKVIKSGKSGGTVTYLKSMNGVKTSITIPATVKIDGITYKVAGIASNAFAGNNMIRKVTIGKNVASIGKKAFYNCRNLKTVTIKSTKLTSSKVGTSAFRGIHKKATIKIPKSKFKSYKSILKKKGIGRGVKYKKLSA